MKADGEQYSQVMKARAFDIEANRMVCLLNLIDAIELGVFPLDRVELTNLGNSRKIVTVIDITKTMLGENEVGIFKEVAEKLLLKEGKKVRVRPVEKPESLGFIKRKLEGETLSESEIKAIVRDIGDNKLSEVEVAAFVVGVYIHGYNLEETAAMTKALTEDGKQLKLEKGPVLDKHCIGGTNGRTTMVVVPIIAAAGYYIPKTSSRSITSAAGTADVMEVLANVCLPLSDIKKITEKVGGVIAWGGALDLAPVDDEIIRVEHPFSLDPVGQIIASVMAKKASVGSKYVVVDLPVGPNVKIKTRDKAEGMAKKIIQVGKKLGIKVE
ncbi:MAG: thymidine phosphorylase, partial [Candidatus Diapherotrites archaeon]|nr:thymidine phosphorylase [Candidatus Diapherotrites archaeon]